ncbi:hypothetical protein TEA_030136 [Camellia sinensis var. sinensis]|uniref:Tify domain-containing protein n=1 Tax=Camellia sinensis var. sinensis TaxID=542762 RepID=A0A4S4EM54_CAMSN|nr:hypothetical protein TEA_030136 [Camellia sinensis var. sinensis]
MYAHSQSLNVPNHFTTADQDPSPCAGGGGGESAADNPHVSYETHSLNDGVGIDDVHIVPSDVVYADGASDLPLQRTDCSNQLTLSFRGQVFVFDDVTTDKVQAVLLLLGASELSSTMQGGELPYENQRESMEYPVRCSLPQRAASLSRFRQKRKERCFDKKIRYNVRQEVALRIVRFVIQIVRFCSIHLEINSNRLMESQMAQNRIRIARFRIVAGPRNLNANRGKRKIFEDDEIELIEGGEEEEEEFDEVTMADDDEEDDSDIDLGDDED